MYNITNETPSESNFKTFGAGVHSDVALESVEFKSIHAQVNNGDPTLAFNFVGPKGEKFTHLEYPADSANDPTKAAGFMVSRVKHILARFMPAEEVVLSGNTYAEFSNAIINLLGTKNKGVKVAVKLTFGTKKYPAKRLGFPKFPDFIASSASDLHIVAEDNMQLASAPATTSVDDMDVASVDPSQDF